MLICAIPLPTVVSGTLFDNRASVGSLLKDELNEDDYHALENRGTEMLNNVACGRAFYTPNWCKYLTIHYDARFGYSSNLLVSQDPILDSNLQHIPVELVAHRQSNIGRTFLCVPSINRLCQSKELQTNWHYELDGMLDSIDTYIDTDESHVGFTEMNDSGYYAVYSSAYVSSFADVLDDLVSAKDFNASYDASDLYADNVVLDDISALFAVSHYHTMPNDRWYFDEANEKNLVWVNLTNACKAGFNANIGVYIQEKVSCIQKYLMTNRDRLIQSQGCLYSLINMNGIQLLADALVGLQTFSDITLTYNLLTGEIQRYIDNDIEAEPPLTPSYAKERRDITCGAYLKNLIIRSFKDNQLAIQHVVEIKIVCTFTHDMIIELRHADGTYTPIYIDLMWCYIGSYSLFNPSMLEALL